MVALPAASPGEAAALTDEDLERGIAERVAALAREYEPPAFSPSLRPDAALFLCAIDHKAGYRGSYLIGGRGPYRGSALLWEVALRHDRRERGWLKAQGLAAVQGDDVAAALRIEGETVSDPERRARLWRDLADGLREQYGGSVEGLVAASGSRLRGPAGLLARLAAYEAFADPLEKKGFLFAKIAERKGWFTVDDPEHWEVCADSVLMRLAMRSGLVRPSEPEIVRQRTREAFKRVAARAGVPVPVLDDLLWERGREDPDLLGTAGGDLREPARPPDTTWY